MVTEMAQAAVGYFFLSSRQVQSHAAHHSLSPMAASDTLYNCECASVYQSYLLKLALPTTPALPDKQYMRSTGGHSSTNVLFPTCSACAFTIRSAPVHILARKTRILCNQNACGVLYEQITCKAVVTKSARTLSNYIQADYCVAVSGVCLPSGANCPRAGSGVPGQIAAWHGHRFPR